MLVSFNSRTNNYFWIKLTCKTQSASNTLQQPRSTQPGEPGKSQAEDNAVTHGLWTPGPQYQPSFSAKPAL